MKNLKTTFLVTIAILFANAVFSQSKFEETLTDKWSVQCLPQINLNGSLTFSDLCPLFVDPNDKSKAQVKTFELTFDKEFVQFVMDKKTTKVKYTDNKDANGFTFLYNDKVLTFKVYKAEDRIILV